MITQFGPANNGKAQLVCSNFNGQLAIWALAPFWLSGVKQVEQTAGGPPGGFNNEIRDGIYIVPPLNGVIQPIPWNGDVYILNGLGPGDNTFNVVVVQPQKPC